MINNNLMKAMGLGLLALGIGMAVVGLYFLKQTQSVKGYYLMAYAGVAFCMYVLSWGMARSESKLMGWATGFLLFFGGFLIYGLTTLTENLSTKGYYFATLALIAAGSFIFSSTGAVDATRDSRYDQN